MSVHILMIFGDSNSGKSSLVRCLSGKGNDRNQHPIKTNVKNLEWGTKTQHKQEPTLVLNSSLNEGQIVPNNARGVASGNYSFTTIHPSDVFPVLDLYEQNYKITRAIMCVSDQVRQQGWESSDYALAMQNHSTFSVTHSIQIGGANAVTVNGSRITVPNAPYSINQIASDVRKIIGLI